MSGWLSWSLTHPVNLNLSRLILSPCRFLYLQHVSVFAARFCIFSTFLYFQHVSVFAVRFCNVLCCVVKLMKMFAYFACVLSTCMCLLELRCVELSGPPYTADEVSLCKHWCLLLSTDGGSDLCEDECEEDSVCGWRLSCVLSIHRGWSSRSMCGERLWLGLVAVSASGAEQ